MAYLNKKNLVEKYNDALQLQQTAISYFFDWERIFRGLAIPSSDESIPDVTDQTYQKIVTELPKRILPKMPQVAVKAASGATEAVLEFYLNEYVLPKCDYGAPPLLKMHHIIRSCANYGVQFATVVKKDLPDGNVGVDFDVPYMGDVMIERGARTAYLANYIFVRFYVTEAWIENKIETESAKPDSTWNVDQLSKLREAHSSKDVSGQTPDDNREDNVDFDSLIEIVYAYQVGKNSLQYILSPFNEGYILSSDKSPDMEGMLPLVPLYYDLNFSNPYGWGLAERLLGQQNQNDTIKALQYRYATYSLAPTLLVKGTVQEDEVALVQDGVINLGADEFSDVKPLDVTTPSHQQYIRDMAVQRQQMHELAGAPTTAGGEDLGFAGASKTPAGVRFSASRVGIADGVLRENVRDFISRLTTLMMQVIIKRRPGKEKIVINRRLAEKLSRFEHQPHKVSVDKKDGRMRVSIDWTVVAKEFETTAARLNAEWEFDKREQAQSLSQALNTFLRDPRFNNALNPRGLLEELVDKMGLDGEKIILPPDVDPEQQKVTPEMVDQMIDERLNQYTAEKKTEDALSRNFKELPEDVKRQYLGEKGYVTNVPSPKERELAVDEAEAEAKGANVEDAPPPTQPREDEDLGNGTPQQQAKAALVKRAMEEKIGDEALSKVMLIADELEEVGANADIPADQKQELAASGQAEIDNIFLESRGKGDITVDRL